MNKEWQRSASKGKLLQFHHLKKVPTNLKFNFLLQMSKISEGFILMRVGTN